MPSSPPILNYSRPEPPERTPGDRADVWAPMLRWRNFALVCAVATPFALGVDPFVGFLTLATLALASVVTLLIMTLTAAREFSRAYATRHLVLALLLLPVLFIGPLLIPHLVHADAKRLRLAEHDEDAAP